ncbi:MAG: efflux RND transporter periplasmic adaptor subunit [Gemmatimonadota bacterium]|nr:efflux RND transporter periplasmic adaptor subunit [Gemmatimonadota bacterium]
MNQHRLTSGVRGSALRAALAALLTASAACSSDDGAAAESGEVHADEQGEAHGDEHAEEGAGGRVTLTEAGLRNAGIEVSEVRSEAEGAAAGGLEVPGRVAFSPNRIALISPRTAGRIERLTVVEGNRVGAGQPVAYILSPAFLTAQNDFIQAVRRAEVLAGTQDEEGARALVTAAQRRLQLLGAPSGVTSRLQSGGEPLDLLPVVAPFAGSIVEAHALAGAAVEPGTPIFKIADLSVVDVVADVPEQALPHLRAGQSATVRLSAYPERAFSGRVERLHDELNPETRTVEAVIHVPNPQRTLRPGMFASVSLRVPVAAGGAASGATLSIPASAIVTDGATRYVFVEVAPRTFERRAVETAPLGDGSRLAILSGLAAGERIVASGAFTLKSELGKAAFGDEH